MRRQAVWLFCVSLIAFGSASRSTAAPSPDPGAVDVVRRYVSALQANDTAGAYALLTPAQRRYFRNARNFASDYATTQYQVLSFSIVRATMHNAGLAQVDVTQSTSYLDVATEQTATAHVTEPYFALRTGGSWGVKEIYEPWKSYAPKTSGTADGLVVVVDRVEFFEHRIQVDCTLRNAGPSAVQVLPLLQSTLRIGDKTIAALNTADFPLNDRQLFEGQRIYPLHQSVGYINFPWESRDDVDLRATLRVGPVVEDGGKSPAVVVVGPMNMPRL